MTDKREETERLAAAPALLLAWYDQNARVLPWRSQPEPYRVWVSEIMLQQTRVEAALPYFLRFMEALPTVSALADASQEQLLKLWEGLGYYSRARNLQKAARMVLEEYGGEIPGEPNELCKLPGIGEYTAGAIASIAFGKAVPAVDGNVLRVLSRLLGSGEDVADSKVKARFAGLLRQVIPLDRPGDFNQALMDLGAGICLPNGKPLCGECPLSELCLAHEQGREEELPVKAEKKARRVEERCLFVLVSGERLAIRRREKKGLLAGLWELPGETGKLDQAQAQAWIVNQGGTICGPAERLPDTKHIFTHVTWEISGWKAELKEPLPGFAWVSREELSGEIPMPSAFKRYVNLFLEEK